MQNMENLLFKLLNRAFDDFLNERERTSKPRI